MASIFKNPNRVCKMYLQNSEDLIFVINENLIIEYSNSSYFSKIKHFRDLVFSDDHTQLNKLLKSIFGSYNGIEVIRIKQSNNKLKWYEIRGNSFIDDEDNNNKKAFLVGRDITKHKKIEFEYEESQVRFSELTAILPEIKYWKLLQSKEGLKTVQKTIEMLEIVIEHIPQLIYWKDTNLVYLGCNGNFASINNLKDPSSIIGKNDDELHWLRGNLDYIKEAEQNVIKNNEPVYKVIESLETIKDEQIWFEINRIPLHDVGGKVVGLLATYEDISIRKLSEQKIRESEKKYRSILENIKESYFEVDLKGTYTFFNDAFCELLGERRDNLLGKNYQGYANEENKNEIFKIYNEVFKSGNLNSNFQSQFIKSNGEEIICESSVYLRYDSNGKRVGFSGLARNITEKKIAEQRLKNSQEELQVLNRELEQKVKERTKDFIKSEQQYRTTIDSLGDPLHVVDNDLRIILVNEVLKKWLKELNIKTDILGRKIFEVFPFLPSSVQVEYNQVFETGIPLITIENTTLPELNVVTETRKIPIFIDNKVNQVITIIKDITDERKMEDQLRESEENYRNMITNLDEGYYKIELDGNILYHNPAFSKIAGYDPHENFINKQQPFIWQNLEDQERYREELLKYGYIRNYTIPVKNKDGEVIFVQLNARLIRNDKERPIAIEGTFTEVTEKFKLEQELMLSEKKLRLQNIELQKLDKVKNDFITMAAHELKTPLISISGYTDYILLKHRSQLNVEITEDLLTVKRNVTRLEILMDQLLDVLKIDENELKLQKEKVNVSMVINDCLDELSYLINDKNLEIILNIDHKIILNVDATRIFAVFTNLISNAIKFTPEYGWIEVSASSKGEDDKYRFEVKDSGIGLSENDVSILFQKFVRIKPPILSKNINLKDSSTGLGLYITRGIVNAHGGEIHAFSEGENKGSKFSFTLPL